MSITAKAGIENGYFGHYVWNKSNNTYDFIEDGKEVTLETIEENLETDDVTLVLSFEYQGKRKFIRVPRKLLAEKSNFSDLAAKGADVTSQNFNYFVNSILLQEEWKEADVNEPILVFSNLGWLTVPVEKEEDSSDDDNCTENTNDEVTKKDYNLFYRSNTLIGSCLNTRYIGDYTVTPHGTFDEWKKLIVNDVVGHTPLELVLLAGLSAVTVGLLSLNDTIGHPIFHLNYASGKGKTTALFLAVSVSSKPFEGSKTETDPLGISMKKRSLYQSWGATENALTVRCAGNHGAVVALNEIGKYKGNNLTQVIYNFSEGTDKDRLNVNLNSQLLDSYHTTFLSCGEESLLNRCANVEGIHTRVMELEEQLTDNKQHSDRIKDICSKNNGFAAPMLAEYIINHGGLEKVLEIYNSYNNSLDEVLPDYPQKGRFIQTFPAIILTTAELATKALKINFDIQGITDFFASYMLKKGTEESKVEKDYNELISHLRSNLKHFNKAPLKENVPEPWGRVIYPTPTATNNYLAEIYEVETGQAHKILKDLGHPNPETTLKSFRDAGYLDHEAKALTRKRKIYADSKGQTKVNVFQVFTDPTPAPSTPSATVCKLLKEDEDE